jgi:hypothetical protein
MAGEQIQPEIQKPQFTTDQLRLIGALSLKPGDFRIRADFSRSNVIPAKLVRRAGRKMGDGKTHDLDLPSASLKEIATDVLRQTGIVSTHDEVVQVDGMLGELETSFEKLPTEEKTGLGSQYPGSNFDQIFREMDDLAFDKLGNTAGAKLTEFRQFMAYVIQSSLAIDLRQSQAQLEQNLPAAG